MRLQLGRRREVLTERKRMVDRLGADPLRAARITSNLGPRSRLGERPDGIEAIVLLERTPGSRGEA